MHDRQSLSVSQIIAQIYLKTEWAALRSLVLRTRKNVDLCGPLSNEHELTRAIGGGLSLMSQFVSGMAYACT